MSEHAGFTLIVLPELFAVCKLRADAPVPDWARCGDFASVTRTPGELSIVCVQDHVPGSVPGERNWRCLQVAGSLDFALVGVLASLTAPLAQAGVSIYAVSTYNTDYLLVPEEDLDKAVLALTNAGHQISSSPELAPPDRHEGRSPL